MAVGIFRKVREFLKKVGAVTRKVAKPMLTLGKKVWEVAKPAATPLLSAIPGVGAAAPIITKGVDTGLNIVDKLLKENG